VLVKGSRVAQLEEVVGAYWVASPRPISAILTGTDEPARPVFHAQG
jgi:hypothetical protein